MVHGLSTSVEFGLPAGNVFLYVGYFVAVFVADSLVCLVTVL